MSAERSQDAVSRMPKLGSAPFLNQISSLLAINATRRLREMSIGALRLDRVADPAALEQKMIRARHRIGSADGYRTMRRREHLSFKVDAY